MLEAPADKLSVLDQLSLPHVANSAWDYDRTDTR